MKNSKQKLIIAGVAVFIIIIAVVFVSLSRRSRTEPTTTEVSIVSSIPAQGASGVSVFDPIVVTFNQDVDQLTFTATSDPTENWTVSQNTPDSLKIDHKLYLRVATTYKLTVLQHGFPIGEITFETAREQNDPRLLQNLQSELDRDYPLAKLTPYETPDYRVVYSAPLTFEIGLKSSIETQEAISQVQSWVLSHGVDPSTHKFEVVSP
jgi:hypothetical protein